MDTDPNNHDPISRLSQIDVTQLPPDGGDAFNRLIFEKSPYLLQHAENPLDWYPWGEEAFERARREDKPVFLSIGYSTCHWCHVMAHESFEDPEVAEVLKRHFICIKVDREERPDIDDTYMTVCQMLTGSGGWPLTLLLSPDGKPFFAATYLPKRSRGGAMGLIELAQRVADLWHSDRKRITEAGEQIHQSLLHLDQGEGSEATLEPRYLEAARSHFARVYDTQHGDFGRAPKFPTAHNLSLLLRIGRRFDDTKARDMALHTLKRMRMARLSGEVELEERGERLLGRLLPMAEQNPQAFGQLLIALDYALGPRQEVVICVPEPDAGPQEMLAVLRRKLRPGTLVLLQRSDNAENNQPLDPIRDKHVVDGNPTAWVCRDQSCREPVTSVEALGQILDG